MQNNQRLSRPLSKVRCITSCRCFWKILETLQLKQCKLDPAYYYTSPELAWDACLKETKQELPLLRDYDMLMMF